MAFRGNPRNVREFEQRLRRIPSIANAERIAKIAAGVITETARASFDAGETAYGDGRPSGKHGPLTLVKTGTTRTHLTFAATGTRIRAVLSTKYAKYLIGKYGVLPSGNAPVPYKWQEALSEITKRVFDDTLGGRA